MATKKKTSAKKASAKAKVETHWLPVLRVQMSGALLEVIAECIAEGKTGMPLRKVIEMADARAVHAAWRQRVNRMLGGF